MRKRQYSLCALILLLALIACGCGEQKVSDDETGVYLLNMDATALEKEPYTIDGSLETEKAVEEMLQYLKEDPKSNDLQSPFPEKVAVKKTVLDSGKLHLHFNEEYAQMSNVREVLLRASLVQSLTQIPGVELIDFYVGDEPLKYESGDIVGYMDETDFIQNTGSNLNSYQTVDLTLFFADDSGEQLVSEKVTVHYKANTSIEKVIVEQLMAGPITQECHPTISPETKLLGVSVKDNICYVNFDEGFLTTSYNLKPTIPIYSIVNSIVENRAAVKVQISINGQTEVNFQSSVDLSKTFEEDLSLVKEGTED